MGVVEVVVGTATGVDEVTVRRVVVVMGDGVEVELGAGIEVALVTTTGVVVEVVRVLMLMLELVA